MITIYKSNESIIETIPEPVNNCWISLVDPTQDEIARAQALGIPEDYLHYPLDLDERARTQYEDDLRLIILRIPHYQGEAAAAPYTTIPFGIILTDRWLITVCRFPNDLISELTDGRIKDLSTAKRLRFVLRILLVNADRYLASVREISRRVDEIEKQLQQSTRNQEMLELFKCQKSLTYFTTALKSDELMLGRIDRSRLFQTYPADEELLDDVMIENQQAIEMTNITSNILVSMMDAYASIISNNVNTVMKLLASVTIIVSLPTLIASFFGMNVPVPMAERTLGFVVVLLFSFAVAGLAIYYFHKRDWL
jgi:magnesium transporter